MSFLTACSLVGLLESEGGSEVEVEFGLGCEGRGHVILRTQVESRRMISLQTNTTDILGPILFGLPHLGACEYLWHLLKRL